MGGRSGQRELDITKFGWQLNSNQGLLAEAIVSQLFQAGTATGSCNSSKQMPKRKERETHRVMEGLLKGHYCAIYYYFKDYLPTLVFLSKKLHLFLGSNFNSTALF